MTLPELKALIVTRQEQLKEITVLYRDATAELARLTVMCHGVERETYRKSRIQRILDDPAAIDRLVRDDEAMERLLKDLE